MFKYILQRLLQLVFVIWSVGTLTFILTRSLPGDMAYRIAASRYGYDQTDAAAAAIERAELGLDQPWWQSYTDWLLDLVQLNLGHSLVSGEAIWAEISHQFGHTLALALVALVLSLLIGPPLGLLAAHKPNGLFDRFTLVISTMLRSVPVFIIGIALITLLAVQIKWLPAAGYGTPQHYILPSLTLAIGLAAVSIRVSHHAMVQVQTSEYYDFAKLKGLSKWTAFCRHGLRNVAIPILAYHSVQLVYLVEGSGHALVHAIVARDVPMIQGTALIMGGMFVVLNMVVDLLSGLLDPRIDLAR